LAWDARNNLRQVLFNIRHTLMDAAGHDTIPTLVSDRQAIQFNPDADLDIDLHKFDRLLEGTRVHDHLNLAGYETYCEALQDAVNLYQGAFLSDFYLEDSNQFEDWTQAIGEAYRRKALDTLASLGEIFGEPVVKPNWSSKVFSKIQEEIFPLKSKSPPFTIRSKYSPRAISRK
jgi:DNA-binding SARP family transcriptional activator